MAYGYELVLDLGACDVTKFTPEDVRRFCSELCAEIDMEAADFHIWASDAADLQTDEEHLHGVSAVQFITTSNITVHTITKLGEVYINIFSCKALDAARAMSFATYFFAARSCESQVLVRGRHSRRRT